MMQINKVFDEWSAEYTEKMIRWVPYYMELLTAVSDGLPADFEAHSVLDLGCGNGNVAAILLNRFPKAKFQLLDASGDMLALGKERFNANRNMAYQQAYFQELDFPSGYFDLVVAGFSLHHLRAPEKQVIFQKIVDWLQPGGCFSFCDLVIDPGLEDEHRAFLKEWERHAKACGTTPEEWSFLMEHYEAYDFPDGLEATTVWLTEAGFNKPAITWQNQYWIAMMAKKASVEK